MDTIFSIRKNVISSTYLSLLWLNFSGHACFSCYDPHVPDNVLNCVNGFKTSWFSAPLSHQKFQNSLTHWSKTFFNKRANLQYLTEDMTGEEPQDVDTVSFFMRFLRARVAKFFDPRAEFATAWPLECPIQGDLRDRQQPMLLRCYPHSETWCLKKCARPD